MDGQELKEAGIARTLAKNEAWKDGAIYIVKNLPSGWAGTGEDIRELVAEEPGHHNAWGGLISAAVSQKLIEPTGDYTSMKSPKSHGRKTPIYRKVL
jgi:hypothetical protein